jgi:hypothetical protein
VSLAARARSFGHRGKVVYPGQHVVVSYEPDKAGIAACAVGPRLAEAVLDLAAKKAMPYAIRISPRSKRPAAEEGDGHRHYQDSFFVEPGTVHDIGKPPMVRVAARLLNTSAQATIVEVGSKRSRAYRVLRRTLDHLNGVNPEAQ